MGSQHNSPLDEANARLNAAFSRMEHSIASLASRQGDAPISDTQKQEIAAELTKSLQTQCEQLQSDMDSLQSENDSLREENAQLSTQLQQVQQDFVALQQITDQVADQIDEQAKQLDLMASA